MIHALDSVKRVTCPSIPGQSCWPGRTSRITGFTILTRIRSISFLVAFNSCYSKPNVVCQIAGLHKGQIVTDPTRDKSLQTPAGTNHYRLKQGTNKRGCVAISYQNKVPHYAEVETAEIGRLRFQMEFNCRSRLWTDPSGNPLPLQSLQKYIRS